MKIINSLKVITLFGTLLALGACDSQSESDEGNKWTVTFDSNGGSKVDPIKVVNGEKLTKPTDPTKNGYTFDAWYQDSILVTPFNFDTLITSNWTLYAGWTEGSSESSSETSSDSEYTSESSESTSETGEASEWYVVGAGSFVNGTEWNVSGGVNLLDNTANSLDSSATGEFYKTITFATDDLWKITNGTVWVQMNCLDSTCPVVSNGDITFVSDGYGSYNAKVVTAGSYTLYFKTFSNASSDGKTGYSLWVEKA